MTTGKSAHIAALLAIACTGLAAAGCSSSSSSVRTVSLANASSLSYLNDHVVGSAFTAAAGYTLQTTANSSGTLEADIAANEISPNVFEAVGGDNITPLEPHYTKWYIQYAGTSMVLAYNPNSKYASQFNAIKNGTKPLSSLFTLLQTPGLKLGRTDPNTDPQGRDFIFMLQLAQKYYNLPSDTVSKILGTSDAGSASSPEIYAESSLDSTLESGQLDAASAFVTQAVEQHLDYIPLPANINLGSASLAAYYKANSAVTIKSGTKHGSPQVIDITIIGTPTPGALAFVKYTLSSAGLAQYKDGGFSMITPTVFGSGVPTEITSELGT
ncbi:MAG TPA: extracellular solute-binding protein [Streptosporangiaceae bacterium]|nr:extracellular solute-binding protein [Streptosporangiaceae bacterium]